MRPVKETPAHRTEHFAELVCSNSLGNRSLETASGLLKEELRRLGSVILRCADANSVPAGGALGVAREDFPRAVTEAVRTHRSFRMQLDGRDPGRDLRLRAALPERQHAPVEATFPGARIRRPHDHPVLAGAELLRLDLVHAVEKGPEFRIQRDWLAEQVAAALARPLATPGAAVSVRGLEVVTSQILAVAGLTEEETP